MEFSKQVKICIECKRAFRPGIPDKFFRELNESKPVVTEVEVGDDTFRWVDWGNRGSSVQGIVFCDKCTKMKVKEKQKEWKKRPKK